MWLMASGAPHIRLNRKRDYYSSQNATVRSTYIQRRDYYILATFQEKK